jgi:hypothetical protein
MLLEACECCFAGVDVPAIGSVLWGFDAEGADRSGTPLVKSAPTPNGSHGTPRRPSMAAMHCGPLRRRRCGTCGGPGLVRGASPDISAPDM